MKYSDLIVWQKAMDLVTSIYKITAAFPDDERFGLTSQIRRAAVLFLPTLPKVMAARQRERISTIFQLRLAL